MKIENIVKDLTDALDLDVPTRMLGIPDQEYVIQISPRQLLSVVEKLWEYGVWHLSTITCLQDEHFTLLYHFWYFGNLTVHLDLIEGDLQVQSICGLIPGAEYYEREIREMYGIEFRGMPNPAPLLLPDSWKGGYPMRRDGQGNIPEIEKKDSDALEGGIS
jgi:NADH:ubiquinone oxidoreductase subunit C